MEDMEQRTGIDILADMMLKSRSVMFITGAGISADSGLPTYRGTGGLYNGKLTEDGISVEEALSGETLKRDPDLTWKYLALIEKKLRGAKYNRAHEVIALFEKEIERVMVFTQNIDGFHRQAGSSDIVDIHGDMHDLFCPACALRKNLENYGDIGIPPLCDNCGGILRPDVVFFGEYLPVDKLKRLRDGLDKGFDLMVCVGTSGLFPYVQMPVIEGGSTGSFRAEIDPEETALSELMDIKIRMKAAEAFDSLWCKYRAGKKG
jgi:NAD-dependent deacetylase